MQLRLTINWILNRRNYCIQQKANFYDVIHYSDEHSVVSVIIEEI